MFIKAHCATEICLDCAIFLNMINEFSIRDKKNV